FCDVDNFKKLKRTTVLSILVPWLLWLTLDLDGKKEDQYTTPPGYHGLNAR
ncbi:hypothetical protein KXX35_009139, partial [Aspergillus fumigatus]